MGSHYCLQQRSFASFYPTIFSSRLPALLSLLLLLKLAMRSRFSFLQTSNPVCTSLASPPYCKVHDEDPNSTFATNRMLMVLLSSLPLLWTCSPFTPLPNPSCLQRWVFHTEKCKYWKQNFWKETVLRLLPVFQGAHLVLGYHGWIWMVEPPLRLWLCASSKPQGCRRNHSLWT